MTQVVVPIGSWEIRLPKEALMACNHPGPCDADVDAWYNEIDWSSVLMTDDQIRSELREHGAWDDEQLANVVDNRKRILWIAAGDYQEMQNENE